MDFVDDPREMSPEARLRELAVILVAGLARLKHDRAELAQPVDPPPLSTDNPLDSLGEPRPSLCDGPVDQEPAHGEVAA